MVRQRGEAEETAGLVKSDPQNLSLAPYHSCKQPGRMGAQACKPGKAEAGGLQGTLAI